MGKSPSKSRPLVRQGKGSRSCSEITCEETARIHLVILGILRVPELLISIRLQVRRQMFVLTQRNVSSAEQETKEGWWKRLSRFFFLTKKKSEKSGLRFSRSCAAAKINILEEPKSCEDQPASSVHARRFTFSKKIGKRTVAGSDSTLQSSGAQFLCTKIRGSNPRRYLGKRAMGPQCSIRLAEHENKLRGNLDENRATFFSPSEVWCLPMQSTMKPWEMEFVVDSGASMHMLRKKDLNSNELETVRVSRTP